MAEGARFWVSCAPSVFLIDCRHMPFASRPHQFQCNSDWTAGQPMLLLHFFSCCWATWHDPFNGMMYSIYCSSRRLRMKIKVDSRMRKKIIFQSVIRVNDEYERYIQPRVVKKLVWIAFRLQWDSTSGSGKKISKHNCHSIRYSSTFENNS